MITRRFFAFGSHVFGSALRSIALHDRSRGAGHEDRQVEGSEELVKRGFDLSRNVLAPLVV